MSETGQPGRNRHPGKKDGSAGRGKGDKSKRRGALGNPLLWILPLILVALLGWSLLSGLRGYRAIDTSDGLTLLKDSASTIKSVTVIDGTQRVELDLTEDYVLKPKESGETEQNLGKKVQFTFTDAQSNQVNRLVQAADPPGGFDSVVPTTSWWASMLQLLVPMALFIGIMWWVLGRMSGGRSGAMGFGRSKAKVSSKEMPEVTFDDVAGEDEAVEELEEIREFLSEPEKFQAVGAKIPKGVLLYGPPGTGKTQLVKVDYDKETLSPPVAVGESYDRGLHILATNGKVVAYETGKGNRGFYDGKKAVEGKKFQEGAMAGGEKGGPFYMVHGVAAILTGTFSGGDFTQQKEIIKDYRRAPLRLQGAVVPVFADEKGFYLAVDEKKSGAHEGEPTLIYLERGGKEIRRFEGSEDQPRGWVVTANYVIQARATGNFRVFDRETGAMVTELKLNMRPFDVALVKGNDVLVYDDRAKKLYRVDF